MAFEKVVSARIWGVTNQNSTARLVNGDSSGGTFTAIRNPQRGTLLWDEAVYVLQGVSVAGGATGGSYTVTLQTDAVAGYTGLPIASVTIGPKTKSTVIMTNSHQTAASPLPTHLFINQTASGGGIWLQLHVLSKQYRGVLGTPGAKTAERILQGNMLVGNSSGGFGDDAGIAASATFTLGTTGSALGLHRMRLWDNVFFWVIAGNSVSGTHDVDIIAKVGGITASIASTGVAGALTAAGQKVAISNNCFGQSPNPTQIIWTVQSAGGVSDARIVLLGKSGRGSLAKH